jgi:hypothetical protein
VHPIKRFLVLLEKIIMSLPVWQFGHSPITRSCMRAFWMALLNASPMMGSRFFISVKTGFRRLTASTRMFSRFSLLFCISSIFSSKSRVSLTEITG